MGGGGQPSNTTTTTRNELPPWLASAYQNYFYQTNKVNNKPYTPYDGQQSAPLTADQQKALQLAGQGASGAGTQGQENALGGILGGKFNTTWTGNPYYGKTTDVGTNPYAGQNSYLQGMIDNSNADITKSYTNTQVPNTLAQFAQGGAFGGSAMQQSLSDSQAQLAKGLAASENQYRFQDYQTQQQLSEDAINRSVAAQQTDLARNSALAQQGFENKLAANNQNASNILNASTGLNGINALQAQYLGQYANLGNGAQQTNQNALDQAYQDWYMKNYGYDTQRLNNLGQALNSVQGGFQSQAVTGPNPNYHPRTAGGAMASAAAGAAAGSQIYPGWGTAIGAVAGAAMYYL